MSGTVSVFVDEEVIVNAERELMQEIGYLTFEEQISVLCRKIAKLQVQVGVLQMEANAKP